MKHKHFAEDFLKTLKEEAHKQNSKTSDKNISKCVFLTGEIRKTIT